jgi:uncharacterized repeat protein (TIGR01451 family)
MRKIILLFTCCFNLIIAQDFEWATSFGSQNNNPMANVHSFEIKLDVFKNIYLVGGFYGTVDFNTGAGDSSISATSNLNIYVAKYDSIGNFIWVRSFQGGSSDYARTLDFDANGNLILTGRFYNSGTFNTGQGATVLTSSGGYDIFICKITPNGNLVWVKKVGGSGDDVSYDADIDVSGNIYVAGSFSNIVDFDPGAGIDSLQANGTDAFVLKLDSAGNFLWVKSFTGPGTQKCSTMQISENSDLYVAGDFTDSCDFDPGTNTAFIQSSGSKNMFLCKLSSSGDYKRIYSLPCTGVSIADRIIFRSGKIYLSGNFTFAMDFDPSGTNYTVSSPNKSIYLCKFDTSGSFDWAKQFYANDIYQSALALDAVENVYLLGSYVGTVNFPAGSPVNSYTGVGTANAGVFFTKLDSLGSFRWVNNFVSSGAHLAKDLIVDSRFKIFGTTMFVDAYDADVSSDTSWVWGYHPNAYDVSFFEFSQGDCSDLNISLDSSASIHCSQQGYISVSSFSGTQPYSYFWNNVYSPDSFITISNPGIYDVQVFDGIGCSETSSVLINGPSLNNGFDLSSYMVNNIFRPGFNSQCGFPVVNATCTQMSGYMMVVKDSTLTVINTVPTADSIVGDSLYWNFSNVASGSAFSPHVLFQVPATAAIGDTLAFKLAAFPVSGDIDTTNNFKTFYFPLVNSYDPNMISVSPKGICEENYILNLQKLTYTIQFQNTGNADALNIFILDSLDQNLDLNSVRVISNSHFLITEVLPGNVLKFRFDNVMLPDSGTNEIDSHGYIIYDVDPLSSLPDATQIKNHADIYFDFNSPVITNSVFVTIVDSLPVCNITTSIKNPNILNNDIKIYPNPSRDFFVIENISSHAQLTIYDLTGRNVLSKKSTAEKLIVNISTLPNGIYMLEVISENKKFFKKIVVSK